MDRIDLPMVGPDATLSDAINVMNAMSCSGVVVDSPLKILDIDTILYTLRSVGDVKVGTVSPRVTTISVSEELSAESILTTPDVANPIEDRMDAEGALYAVTPTAVTVTMAVVLARHEDFKNAIGVPPSLWRCKLNPSRHVWRYFQLLQPGEKCRNDRSDTEPI